MHDGALFSWKWLYICLMKGGSEQIPYFILIALTIFALPIKLSLSQPTSFLTLSLSFLILFSDSLLIHSFLILFYNPLLGSEEVAV